MPTGPLTCGCWNGWPPPSALDAFLADLAAHTGPGTPQSPAPAYCTILAAGPGTRSAHAEVLASLVIAWLTTQVPAGTAVIVAGADEIAGYQLERLADACDRTGTPLTLLFRHLRNDATALIGAGATAFMRLGNHHEAEQAASFIGRQHKFVLSSLTGGRTRSRDFSKNYSWATEFSRSDGTNWSDATTRERVYEYAVEPGVLQRLPDTALLLISDNSDVQPVECHPAIVTLPQASTVPVQPVQPPAPLPRADQYQPQ